MYRIANEKIYLVAPEDVGSEVSLQRIADFTDKMLSRAVRPPSSGCMKLSIERGTEEVCKIGGFISVDGSMEVREAKIVLPRKYDADDLPGNDVLCCLSGRIMAEVEYRARKGESATQGQLRKAQERYRYSSYWLLREDIEKEGRITMGVLPDLERMGALPGSERRIQNIFSPVKITGFSGLSGLFNFETE